jgi:hypothetical protein
LMNNERLTRRQAKYVQDTFRVPVDETNPKRYWVISLDRGSRMPTDGELAILRSYCEFLIHDRFNEGYARRVLARKLCRGGGGYHTTVFRKGMWVDGTEDHWFYRMSQWSIGPIYVPSPVEGSYRSLDLVGVMDKIEGICPQHWIEWKEKDAAIF